ncbi:MAG TPA: site-2 protease family protein, partial [Candidatus Obscuribacterales bacterium]
MHILLVVLVLALLIAFHEFGHFICAKSLGVPVKIFSIGFPMGTRPLLSFRWGETDVQLNPLPLGGFCAFMDD